MKKIFFAFLLCAGIAVSAFAQNNRGVTITGDKGTSRVVLTPAQSSTLTIPSPGVSGCSSFSEQIESMQVIDGKIEVVKRSTCFPSAIPAVFCWPKDCDWAIRRVWREVYVSKNGKIVLESTTEGKIIPAKEESIEWPK